MNNEIYYILDLIALGLIKELPSRIGDIVTRRALAAYDVSLAYYGATEDPSMDLDKFKEWIDTEKGAKVYAAGLKFSTERLPFSYDTEIIARLQRCLNDATQLHLIQAASEPSEDPK